MIEIKKNKYKKAKLTKIDGVVGSVKKFDEKLHTKYDIEARNILKNILGNEIKDNPDIYGEDMIFTREKFPFKYLEVQVLSKWDDKFFPYDYPFVYARKMRFSTETLFITFNKLLSEAIIFSRKNISNIPSKLKKYDREYVNYVPWNKALKLKSHELTIQLILSYCGIEIFDEDIIQTNEKQINELEKKED